MAREFEVRFEGELPAATETVWTAITTPQTEGWLWRIDYEPRLGGAERGLMSGGGAVTAWEPGRRFATRAEKPGWYNQLEYELEPRGDATGIRFRHTTEFEDGTFARESAACVAHTGRVEATIDCLTPEFLGLRTDDALHRIYGRDAWGWPVGAAHHLFGDDVDGPAAERAWGAWLGGLVAEEA